MVHQPQPNAESLPVEGVRLKAAQPPQASIWHQPRGAAGAYVEVERRALPALTSLRFFAALYVVVHHLINVALLHLHGEHANRAATWYLAWGTQGHVGVTFFFVLSGFILAWCYHRAFSTPDPARSRGTTRRFYLARFARVWPLHAVMFAVFLPLALLKVGASASGLFTTAWQGGLNLTLLHAWVPWGGSDGISDTFNAPSWTLSCEVLFYMLFPALAALLVQRLRWGVAQLALLVAGAWGALGVLAVSVSGLDRGDWLVRVFPAVRLIDFVIGVAIGLIVVQRGQLAALAGRSARPAHSNRAWTALEAVVLAGTCLSPLVWALWASHHLPGTLGTSWFHLPAITATILVLALERGAISRRVLAVRPLVWLGEVSYALYLIHLFLVLGAYRVGAYDVLGTWPTSLLLIVAAIAISAVVHERFEKPVRARIVSAASARRSAAT